jgi:hypothetical protein
LFGTDHSSSAHWAYVWGVKGRYDEPHNERSPDLDDLNDYNRHLYRQEVDMLVQRLNNVLAAGSKRLYTPDIKFNRSIGKWAGQMFHPQTGERMEDKEYSHEVNRLLPIPEDRHLLMEIITNERNWIAPKTGARDPFETIGEPRKSAINL